TTIPRPPPSPLFPYTTLFRSHSSMSAQPIPWTTPPCTCPRASVGFRTLPTSCTATKSMTRVAQVRRSTSTSATRAIDFVAVQERSEEHTSELQSLRHLVCRLL